MFCICTPQWNARRILRHEKVGYKMLTWHKFTSLWQSFFSRNISINGFNRRLSLSIYWVFPCGSSVRDWSNLPANKTILQSVCIEYSSIDFDPRKTILKYQQAYKFEKTVDYMTFYSIVWNSESINFCLTSIVPNREDNSRSIYQWVRKRHVYANSYSVIVVKIPRLNPLKHLELFCYRLIELTLFYGSQLSTGYKL